MLPPSDPRRQLAQVLASIPQLPPQGQPVVSAAPPMMPQQVPTAPAQAPQSIPPAAAADQFYRQGVMALENYDYPGAANAWRQALALNPNHQGAQVSLNHISRLIGQNTRLGRSTTEGYR